MSVYLSSHQLPHSCPSTNSGQQSNLLYTLHSQQVALSPDPHISLLPAVVHPPANLPATGLPSKVVFHQRSFSIYGHLPFMVILYPRSSSIQVHIPSKVVFNARSSSIQGYLPSNVLSSIQGCFKSKVLIHQRCPPSKVVFH